INTATTRARSRCAHSPHRCRHAPSPWCGETASLVPRPSKCCARRCLARVWRPDRHDMNEQANAPEHIAITRFKGVGPRAAERLGKLGLRTLEDVLFHLPFRYEDRTRITPIGSLRPEQGAVIEGAVLAADVVYGKRRSLL